MVKDNYMELVLTGLNPYHLGLNSKTVVAFIRIMSSLVNTSLLSSCLIHSKSGLCV